MRIRLLALVFVLTLTAKVEASRLATQVFRPVGMYLRMTVKVLVRLSVRVLVMSPPVVPVSPFRIPKLLKVPMDRGARLTRFMMGTLVLITVPIRG